MKTKRKLLVLSTSTSLTNRVRNDLYKGFAKLSDIYDVRHISRLEAIRGYTSDSLVYKLAGYYNIKEIDAILDYIKTHKIPSIY